MRRNRLFTLFVAVTLATGSSSVFAATADLTNTEGASVGTIELTETPNGVRLHARLMGLPAGVHGFHIHETGACAPDFGAAGGHLAGGAAHHGFDVDGGPHAGDMPNIHVPESGMLEIEYFNPMITFEEGAGALFDADGSAIIIHADADDYKSHPSGDAGNRIACGVIEK